MSHVQIHRVKLAKRLTASTKSIHAGPKIKTRITDHGLSHRSIFRSAKNEKRQINGKFNFYYLSIFCLLNNIQLKTHSTHLYKNKLRCDVGQGFISHAVM